MYPVSYTNTHHIITVLVNRGMVKNTKIWTSWEWNITFLRNKKIINLCIRSHNLRSYPFVAKVTLNFYTRILDCGSHDPARLDFFLSSDASICFTMTFPPLGFPISSHCLWLFLCWLGQSRWSFERFEWVQGEIDAYIPHQKCKVKPHSSPWFSAACTAAIVHRNHFFRLYQREKSSDSKVKFRQASNRCKKVLEAAKLAYANKIKESITSLKLGSWDFQRIVKSVLNKGKSVIPPRSVAFCIW